MATCACGQILEYERTRIRLFGESIGEDRGAKKAKKETEYRIAISFIREGGDLLPLEKLEKIIGISLKELEDLKKLSEEFPEKEIMEIVNEYIRFS